MRTLTKHNDSPASYTLNRWKLRAAAVVAATLMLGASVARGDDPAETETPLPPAIADVARTPETPKGIDTPTDSAPVVPLGGEIAPVVTADLVSPAAPTTQPIAAAPTTQPVVAAPATQPVAVVEEKAPATPEPAPTKPEAAPTAPVTTEVPILPIVAPAAKPALAMIAPAPATQPATLSLFENLPADGRINLLVGRHLVLKTRTPYKRISVTQPEVASDNLIDPTSIVLTAKKAGSTQLIVWDDKDRSQVVDLLVDVDLNALTEMVKKNFPSSDISLSNANGTLVVRGRVPSLQTAEQVVELLSAYGKVINFLEMSGGQQVMMQVRFAEVSRSASTALGVNFGFNDGVAGLGSNVPGGGPYNINGTVGNLTRSVGAGVTIFGGGRIGNTDFDVLVSALRNNNLLRVLAEPNLSTMSGKEAKFLAGGEFPIPVPQAGGGGNAAITVEYKQFGIQLTFVPVVLGDGRIRLKGTAEVSDLDYSRSVTMSGFVIPSLTKRTVTNEIELQEGQTFAVAGLLNNRVTAAKQAIPLLGDLPVFGALFRSVRYERNETELVVLVTPRLVEAMNPKQVPELPGARWIYPTENDLFLNSYLGGQGAKDAAANKPGPVRYRGLYGFVPATGQQLNGGSPSNLATTGLDE